MKIEMGESIVYSWLRHVKGCQIVQNNWKVSPNWGINHSTDLQEIMDEVNKAFDGRYDIFKKNSLLQFLRQGECDAIGFDCLESTVYGVDVAFHKEGLNYGDRKKTVAKVIEKCVRTAMCMYAYLDKKEATIVFASPKTGKRIGDDIISATSELSRVMGSKGYKFSFEVVLNSDFKERILDPVLLSSGSVDDTAELFMRSYQLVDLYYSLTERTKKSGRGTLSSGTHSAYASFKIGQLANVVLRDYLEKGKASAKEIADMQTKPYSKKTFGLQYPLLVAAGTAFDPLRYYSAPVTIRSNQYNMCSQWFESKSRLLLENWINTH